MKVLVTGTAGFIGSHVAMRLLERGDDVVGIDNLSDYYDVELKKARLARFSGNPAYRHKPVDLADRVAVEAVFARHKPQRVINLAAQAGVRYAAENPHIYVSTNVTGFLHVIEGCRHHGVEHLVYASTSSVYGADTAMPFSEHQPTEHPLTLYAASKKANEMMAHSYAHLYGLPCTGLRFFTVYGPWGRPDMAMWIFVKALYAGEPLPLFNGGEMRRDFTYIDDIVRGVIACLDGPPEDDSQVKAGGSTSPHALYNIGNSRSEDLMRVVELLEQETGRKALLDPKPMQIGDVHETFADISAMERDHGFKPATSIDEGVPRFVKWYRDYHRL